MSSHLWVEAAFLQVWMISVKKNVNALSDPGDAHEDKQFSEEDRLTLKLSQSWGNAVAVLARCAAIG